MTVTMTGVMIAVIIAGMDITKVCVHGVFLSPMISYARNPLRQKPEGAFLAGGGKSFRWLSLMAWRRCSMPYVCQVAAV